MTALATINNNGNAQLVHSQEMSPDQVELIKRTIAVGTTDDELKLFIHVCNRTGLDPFARQVYCIKRNAWNSETRQNESKMSIQVSIDGMRLVAERSGKYAGSETFWCGEDGVWRDVWLEPLPPAAAKTIVYKSGSDRGFVGVARFNAYAQTFKDKNTKEEKLGSMWQKMPDVMIGKCSEALALRKAFPQELSGLYSREEMEQAGGEVVEPVQTTPSNPNVISTPQRKRIFAIAKEHGITTETVKSIVLSHGFESTNDITRDAYEAICDEIKNFGKPIEVDVEVQDPGF